MPSPYATLDDVQSRMPQFQLTDTSKPAKLDAQTYLDDVHAEVDSALNNLGYQTPVTGPLSLAQLRALECQGTIARILYARAAAVGSDVAVKSADRAQKMYDDTLLAWKDQTNPKELTDAQRTGFEVLKPDQSIAGLTILDNGEPNEPRARMDRVF